MLRNVLKQTKLGIIKDALFPYKNVADSYYYSLFMSSSGATLFWPENLYAIDHAIKNLPTNDPVLEIGSFAGMSTNILIHYLRKYKSDNILFNCDKWDFEEKENVNWMYSLNRNYNDYCRFIRESFIRNVEFFSSDRLPHTIELFSNDFFDKWNEGTLTMDIFGRTVKLGGALSFAFVDGNHSYDFVKQDFENINKYLVKGGFIFFDDSADFHKCGVPAVIKEIKKRKDYEVVIKNPNYLLRKIA